MTNLKNMFCTIFGIKLITLFFLGISPVNAVVTCVSNSRQCCWVRRMWELMGRTAPILVSPTHGTACCQKLLSTSGALLSTQPNGIPGVYCTLNGDITAISWGSQSLTGGIPSQTIGMLSKLKYL
jgi:hypothetical protein